jgi:hypothetical protein
MAIKFGSTNGYKTRTDFRISEGELDCGNEIHMFIKNIEKSMTIEDEFTICSIGVIGQNSLVTQMCYETVSITLREEVAPKYKPVAGALGATAAVLETMGANGEAATELACDLKVKNVSVEVTATFKEMDQLVTADEILTATTSDGLTSLSTLIGALPAGGNWIKTSHSVDQPADDFGSQTITYTKKIPYPTDLDRTGYAVLPGSLVFTGTKMTMEKEASLRQGDVPMVKFTTTEYGVANTN